jgi:hypothetical protein
MTANTETTQPPALRCPPAAAVLTPVRDRRRDPHRRRDCQPPATERTGTIGHFVVRAGYTTTWTIDTGDLWICPAGHRHRLHADGYFRRPYRPVAERITRHRVFCEVGQ